MTDRATMVVDKELYERDRTLFRDAIREVEALIEASRGVAGLHLNGDVATWGELRTDGRFCWLEKFDEAAAIVAAEDASVVENAASASCDVSMDDWDMEAEFCDE